MSYPQLIAESIIMCTDCLAEYRICRRRTVNVERCFGFNWIHFAVHLMHFVPALLCFHPERQKDGDGTGLKDYMQAAPSAPATWSITKDRISLLQARSSMRYSMPSVKVRSDGASRCWRKGENSNRLSTSGTISKKFPMHSDMWRRGKR